LNIDFSKSIGNELDILEQVFAGLQTRMPVILQFSSFSSKEEDFFSQILEKLLEPTRFINSYGLIHTSMREMIQNACKANFKRKYFADVKINSDILDQYEAGMLLFKAYIKKNRNGLKESREGAGNRFEIKITKKKNSLWLSVCNYFPLHAIEEKRIRQKFSSSSTAVNLYEYYKNFMDDSEGAGLGIAMVRVLLEKAGISMRNFSIYTDSDTRFATSRIILPTSQNFVSPRVIFEEEQKRRGCTAGFLRSQLQKGLFTLDDGI